MNMNAPKPEMVTFSPEEIARLAEVARQARAKKANGKLDAITDYHY